MVLYLKYRPQSLSELIGQETVKNTLQKAHAAGKLAHAYVFYGPRGTGKTSTARILAKMINCEAQQNTGNENSPCNQCATCLSITNGSNLDVIEIDAASNRGIDDIRELREKVRLVPSASKKKVYIIDEAHMLTTEAFNALLKTLEEPPPPVLFNLATTPVSKLPPTILSRVQKLNFRQAAVKDLVTALQKVIAGENFKADEEAVALIAKKSEGSFRDALKIIDQLSSANAEISASLVEEGVKSGSFEQAIEILEILAAKNAPVILEKLSKHLELGINIKEYISSLTDLIRSMLFIKLNVASLVKEQEGSGRFEVLVKLQDKFTAVQIISLLDNLHRALEKMRYASIVSLPLEIALIESCLDANQTITVPIPVKTVRPLAPQEQVVIPPVLDDMVRQDDVATLQDKWTYILETVKPFNYSLEALLRSVKILSCDDGKVILEVPYSFHQRILETPRNRDMLESVLSDILNKSAQITCVLGKRPVRASDLANIEVAADDEVIRLASEIFNSDPAS